MQHGDMIWIFPFVKPIVETVYPSSATYGGRKGMTVILKQGHKLIPD